MERIATDISSFEKLRRTGCVYVDKTDMLWRIVSNVDGSQFFIARPRRFAKSLMLSTLQCIFEGRRELFKGLKIEKKKYDWKTYPVVHLDMSGVKGGTPEGLIENLHSLVDGLLAEFKLGEARRLSEPGRRFGLFLECMAEKYGEYVVLVDEYDVPLQGFLGNRTALRRVRQIMHDFYVQLKAHSGAMRFLMLTGVTKLTKLSVFSGLNHLTDLSMKRKEYAALLGYAPKEIAEFFPKRLDALAKRLKTDRKGALKGLLDWYDSYRFSHLSTARVCNPISIGQALLSGALQSYWVATAASTLVMERIAAANKTPADFEGCTATVDELDLCEATELPAKSLMYQSGYLTIKGLSKTEVDEIGNPKLVLAAPNREVRGAARHARWRQLPHGEAQHRRAGVYEVEKLKS